MTSIHKIVFTACLLFQIPYIVNSQNVTINEFLTRNTSVIKDKAGQYDDWLEIYNSGTSSIDLNNYYITDDLTNRTKHKLSSLTNEFNITPNGYLILWADNDLTQGGTHLSFKLSGDSGVIALFSPAQVLVDSVKYWYQADNVSMGRNAQNNWNFYKTPTPGTANNTAAFIGVSRPPHFSIETGTYSIAQSLNITKVNLNDTVRYTTNNTNPTKSSARYTTPLNITKTTVVQSVSMEANWVPSNIKSHLYIINETHALPILAVITDSFNLWGAKGIYTNYSKDGIDWERYCQLKYFDTSGLLMESNGGIRIQGGSSIGMAKKSFRLFFRSDYGNSQLEYPIFGTGKLAKFNKLVLKAGYDDDISYDNADQEGTLLRDALTTAKWISLGGLRQYSNWVALYLNNRYWGIYCIRESIDEDYIHDHTGLNEFDLIRFHNPGPELKFGDQTAYDDLYNYIITKDLSITENYNFVASQMDIDNFATLVAMVECSGYYSWAWGVSMYRPTNPIGKWKFSIWDTDRAYGDVNWNGFKEARLAGPIPSSSNYKWGNNFIKHLLENQEFKRLLANRICDLLNTEYEPSNAINTLDSLYNIIKPEVPNELQRWDPKFTGWETNVQAVRDYLNERPAILRQQMVTELGVQTQKTITVNVNGSGYVKVNHITPLVYPWTGSYYSESSIDLEAVPANGYKFVGWYNAGGDLNAFKNMQLLGDSSITAYFEYDPYSLVSKTDKSPNIRFYPNPVKENLQMDVNLETPSDIQITISATDGRVVALYTETKLNAGQNQFKWNCSIAPAGLYMIRMNIEGHLYYQKIVVTK